MFERFTTAARAAVVQAQAEARDSAAPRIGTPHLLAAVLAVDADTPLGALCADAGLTAEQARIDIAGHAADRPLGEADAEALRSIGIDLDAVRDSIEAAFGADALDGAPDGAGPDGDAPRRGWFGRSTGHIPFTPAAKKAIELALREALARKDPAIGSEHLLLGVLRGADPAALTLIEPHIAPAELRRRIVALLGRAA